MLHSASVAWCFFFCSKMTGCLQGVKIRMSNTIKSIGFDHFVTCFVVFFCIWVMIHSNWGRCSLILIYFIFYVERVCCLIAPFNLHRSVNKLSIILFSHWFFYYFHILYRFYQFKNSRRLVTVAVQIDSRKGYCVFFLFCFSRRQTLNYQQAKRWEKWFYLVQFQFMCSK